MKRANKKVNCCECGKELKVYLRRLNYPWQVPKESKICFNCATNGLFKKSG